MIHSHTFHKRVGLYHVRFEAAPVDETGASTRVQRQSLFTGRINEMVLPVTLKHLLNWNDRELIQNAFPQLNADQREFLLSGATPEEWEARWGDEDEEGE